MLRRPSPCLMNVRSNASAKASARRAFDRRGLVRPSTARARQPQGAEDTGLERNARLRLVLRYELK